jgi:3',5'-cyclic AMP phosphodiesterase CpdA
MSKNYKINDNELLSQLKSRDTNESFVFAQISDPHLSSLDSVSCFDLANKRVLGYLSWRKKRKYIHKKEILDSAVANIKLFSPDHIVITGDLTHIGHPTEFDETLNWLQELGQPSDITLIPGNHDCYVADEWDNTFKKWAPYFCSEYKSDTSTSLQNSLADIFPTLTIKGHTAFIGLSSAVQSAPLFATGSLGSKQIQKLRDLLNTLKDSNLFKVLLIHHPPVEGVAKWRKRLTDANELLKLFPTNGIDLVLHGHEHKKALNFITVGNNSVPVIGMPSTSSMGHTQNFQGQYYLYHVINHAYKWEIILHMRGVEPTLKQYCTTATHQYFINK